uniref:TNF superfamily member 11 n=1 Tax=Amphiprion percula TaxID=161767 RepID=A0A3P8TYS9_AMPPE
MAATHSEYRGYLRNTVDIEAPTYRPLLFGTLAVMGLLQVASSVAILLHLTGYLQEVDLSMAPHRPIEEVQTEPVLNALRDTRKNRRCKAQRENLPAAHLLIRVDPYPKAVTIDWDEEQSYRNRMDYQKGKLLVMEAGFYYVYTNICFRFYNLSQSEDSSQVRLIAELVRNAQLIQYVYRDSIKQTSKAQMLMKTGSTMRWHNTTYSMYCSQQGRGVRLDKGDALFVNVSNSWMLDREGEGTYFGAIKLGN